MSLSSPLETLIGSQKTFTEVAIRKVKNHRNSSGAGTSNRSDDSSKVKNEDGSPTAKKHKATPKVS